MRVPEERRSPNRDREYPAVDSSPVDTRSRARHSASARPAAAGAPERCWRALRCGTAASSAATSRNILNTTVVPDIERQRLHRPQHLAGVHVESHHGIRSGRRAGECIACCNVKRAPSHIERRRYPHTGAGRRQHVFAQRVFADDFRGFGNGVGLPDFFSGAGIECSDKSSERAAGVIRLAGLWFFERRDGHVQASFIQRRRAGDASERMGIRQCLPDYSACRCIERICGAANISEEDRSRAFVRLSLPMVKLLRTAACARKAQCTQPESASSEYT